MPDTYDAFGRSKTTGQWYGKSNGQWVKVTALDVANARRAAQPPGAVKRLLTQAVGLPENVDTSWQANKAVLPSLAQPRTWWNATKQAVESLNPLGGMSDAETSAENRFKQPGAMNKVNGILEWLESGFPYAGPAKVRGDEQMLSGDTAGGIGSDIQAALMARIAPEAAQRLTSGPLRSLAQFATGIGPENVDKARTEFGEGVAADETAHTKAAQAAVNNVLDKLSKERGLTVGRSASESGASARAALDPSSLRGPVYQRVQGMADTAGQEVGRLDQDIRKFQNGEWQKLDQVAGDTRVPPPDDAIQAARANLKTPDSIATFDRVMDKVREEAKQGSGERALTGKESTASLVAGKLLKNGMSPKDLRSTLLNQGFPPRQIDAIVATIPGAVDAANASGAVPFDEARAQYTALQRQMYAGRGLPGDVYNALKQVRDQLDTNIRKSLPDGAARNFYDSRKASYAQYMQDFYDPDGAFTKIKGAPTSVDRLNILTGKWGKEALDAMARYRQFNPKFNSIADLRALNRTIENLPRSAPSTTGGFGPLDLSAKPLPEDVQGRLDRLMDQLGKSGYKKPPAPEVRVFDPVEARRNILKGKVPGEVVPSFTWRYRLFRALQHKLANLPTVQDWLVQNPK